MSSKTFTLPAFPLNLIVLPGETKVLHIFEERYRELVNDCLKNKANFGIPFLHKSKMEGFGSIVQISNVLQIFPNGEMDIEITGVAPFKIIRFTRQLSPKLYGAANIEEYEVETFSENVELILLLNDYIQIIKKQKLFIEKQSGISVYKIAQFIDLINSDKLELIRLPSLASKENFLIEKIRFSLKIAKIERDLGERFTMN